MSQHVAIDDLLDLSGRTALVTGGAMGIGQAIARRLAEARADVVVCDADLEAAEQTCKVLVDRGLSARAVRCDVAHEEEVEEAIDRVMAWTGRLDVLVNDAGIYPARPVLEMSTADFDRVLAVNLRGTFLMCRAAARVLVGQAGGGNIHNITSVDAVHPSSVGLAHYDASKHGVWGFTKNLARELAPHHVRVNALAPGGVATPGVAAGNASGELEEALAAFASHIPMGRLGEPDEIATVALFMVSGMATYMTGTQVVVDGGVLLA
jgi:2-deoxy-D-gluconate 3-dehydrogenase